VPAPDTVGLFYEGDIGEAAAIQFSGGRQSGHSCADDTNSVIRVSGLGYSVCLFNQ
jgi:hypothetical protein